MPLFAAFQSGISKAIIAFAKSQGGRYQQTPLTEEEQQQFLVEKQDTEESGEDESHKPIAPPATRPYRVTVLYAVTYALTVLTFLIYILVSTHHHFHRMDTGRPEIDHQGGTRIVEHCGDSVEEAEARGCIWDLMSFRWVHPACYNQAESEAWLQAYGPWKWYLEYNNTESELGEKDLPYQPRVWTQQGFHVAHCLYIWKLLHLAGMKGCLVDDQGIEIAHSDHCAKMLLRPDHVPFEKVITRVDVLFGKCVTMY